MNLLDLIRVTCADALDSVHAVIPDALPAHVTVIVSHPGKAEDAIVIGEHELSDLFAILKRLETHPVDIGRVSVPDGYKPEGRTVGRLIQ